MSPSIEKLLQRHADERRGDSRPIRRENHHHIHVVLQCWGNVGGVCDGEKNFYDTVLDKYLLIIVGVEQFCNMAEMPFEEALSWLKAYEDRTRSRTPGGGLMINGQLLLSQGEWESRQKKGGGDMSSS